VNVRKFTVNVERGPDENLDRHLVRFQVLTSACVKLSVIQRRVVSLE
jgi:hypothetical protein